MMRVVSALLIGVLLGLGVQAQDGSAEKRSGQKAGDSSRSSSRPGSLSREDEERFDEIIERFIRYDTGLSQDRRAREELDALGPEAIPALIRGINRAARMSHSCPVSVLHRKLRSLLRSVDDERTLRFAYDNIGAGVGRSPYNGLLNDLKLTIILRRRELDDARRAAAQRGDIPGAADPFAPAGLRPKSPGEQTPSPEGSRP
ncbi:MAG: hypothetical protein NZM31_10130 [Gemmatales bacterium]|nr:hypothetical protein [Gemmatales bacterium]MDW8387353.1 hypothetical protein [Gemmatales bacterium]